MSTAPRLTFAGLVLKLQRRAGGTRLHPRQMGEVLAGLSELVGKEASAESATLRQILAAVLGVHRDLELEGRALGALSPETVLRLDAVLTGLVDGTMQRDELRTALRRALIRPAS